MKRILYLDIIRIVACLMIIAMHAPIPNTGLNSYILSTDSLMTATGIGLFIMVSGALILPVNLPTKQFLKKRFCKIAWPTLLWTLFYMLIYWYEIGLENIELWRALLSIPFIPQFNGVLWFMYMLAGLYLLAPILSSWIKQSGRREIEFYLCLWGITLCYPLIRNFIGVNEGHTGILFYFGGYAGYFLLGYYLKNYMENMKVWMIFIFLIIPLTIAAALKIQQIQVEFYDTLWYLSILVAMMAVAWFMLIKGITQQYEAESLFHKGVVLVSNCCFGIYLVHIFIMHSIIWHWEPLHSMGVLQILIVTLLTFIGSFAVTWFISYLPWAEYIIGFRQKR